jgi:AraC family transcriptional regulator
MSTTIVGRIGTGAGSFVTSRAERTVDASMAHPSSLPNASLPSRSIPVAAGASENLSRELTHVRVSRIAFAASSLAAHYHDHACLCFLLSGGFTKRFTRRTLECVAGTVLVQPAGERHADVMHGSQQVVIEPLAAASKFAPVERLFDEIRFTRSPVATAVASRIAHELAHPDDWSALSIEALAFELIARAGRIAEGGSPHGPTPKWLLLVRDRLVSEPTAPTIAELASLAQVHPVYLGRMFRRHFGLPIGAYARRLRLEWAAQQLTATSEPLSRISFHAGFADQSHFTREFRRFSGLPPRQYRLATRR